MMGEGEGVPIRGLLIGGANSMTLPYLGLVSNMGEVGEGVKEARYGCGEGLGSGEQGKPLGKLMGMTVYQTKNIS